MCATSTVGGEYLSYTQESLWLTHQLTNSDEPAYNESLAFELTGKVDRVALRDAVNATIARHAALRTRFYETKDGPRAEVLDSVPDSMTIADLRGVEAAEARADELLTDHYRRHFDLGTAPLLRTLLVALPDDAWIFAVTAHHIVVDDWSLRIILDEVGENYRAAVAGRPPRRDPAPDFRDFVRRTRAAFDDGDYADKIENWRRSLESSPPLLGMPLDRPRPARQTFRGGSVTVTVPGAEVDTLLDACRRECRSTSYQVFLAAYAVLLSHYTGQEGFAIGTTVLNRSSEDDLALVGCCVNTLPLYVPVDRDATFRQLLAVAQEPVDRLLDDGDAPYPKVLEALRAERAVDHNPVFQTMLTLLGDRPAVTLGPDVTARHRHVRRAAAKFDLMLYLSRIDEGYEFELEFNTDLFTPATAERVLRNYARLLASLADGLDHPVRTASMLRAEDEHLILDVWNDTAADYPAGNVIDLIEERVRRNPDAVAVEFDGQTLTYGELDRRAGQVARTLRRTVGATEAGTFVGVYLDRSIEMVVALLAIVKAGYAYVPIDPEYPPARIEFMIEDAGLPLVLTQEHHRGALDAMGVPVLVLSSGTGTADAGDDAGIDRDLGPDSPVYMIYTSGSTGRPKGVINRHVSLFNRLYWMQSAFELTGDDRVLQKTPYSFDVSVWEFFWPLMFGAAIVMARPGGHRDPEYLKQVIRDRRVTTVHFVPSMLNVFLEADELAEHCGSLRRVVCSGEALPRETIEVFHRRLSCELHNLYGPTEAAIDVSHWPCTLDYPGDIVPIGRPIANVRLYVMDRERRLLPIGVPGELCIGGVAVASGYHRRDELSREVFLTDPYGAEPETRLYRTGDLARFLPDGQIQYLGRIDNQVKLRGLRVEPDEVAAVIRGLPGVTDAAVVVHTSGGTQALAAYVVSGGLDRDETRARLRETLPEFLVPQFIVEVPALPTTPNGKLDRRALPDPLATGGGDTGAPLTTAKEHEVARVWRQVLGRDALSADSGFFALGGDSILALRVAARLREAGYAVELRDLFAHPTLAGLASSLERDTASAAVPAVPAFALVGAEDRALLPADAEDAWPLTKLQAGMIYHSLLDEASPVYHDIFDYRLSGEVDPDAVRQAVRTVVARHGQLRSTFDLDTCGEPLQVVLPSADVQVETADLTRLEPARQNQVIDDWVEQEKRRPFDLSRPPLRFRLHLLAKDEINLGISFHHLILDGWSVALIMEEIRRLCAESVTGRETGMPAPAPGYGTYVTLERESMKRGEDRAAWQELLAGFSPTLLADARAAGGPARPAAVERAVPAELEDSLRRRAASLGLPLKSLYLAAHCAALAKVTGGSRVITGLVGNGRPEIPGGTEMIGLFLNTVPFPIEVPDTVGAEFAASVFDREQGLIPYQRFPLAEIERMCGGRRFDVAFNYTDFHVYSGGNDKSVRIEGARYFELTSFPLVVHVHKDQFTGSMELVACHDAAAVGAAAAESFLDHFLAALDAFVVPVADDAAPPGHEEVIAGIIARAVGLSTLGMDANYLDAGVDSITAIRILTKLRKLFPAATMRDVIEMRTVRALARRLQTRGDLLAAGAAEQGPAGAPGPGRLPGGVVDAYPATALQLHMIEMTREDPAQSAYHDVFAYSIRLPLDERVLRTALTRVIDAYETLRTAFDLDAAPVPRQLVYGSVEPDLTVVDAAGDPGRADEWFERERGSGFAWDRPGLMRFAAHRTGEESFVLSLSFHHSIIDGWSLSIVIRDLLTTYAAELSGERHVLPARPGPAYRDYVRAEAAAQSSAESAAFWRAVLDGHPGTVPPRPRRDAAGPRWAETTVALPLEQEDRLRSVAQQAGCPLKHLMLAAHLRTLSLLGDDTDVVTGVFTHGRLEAEGADRSVGMFLNFQPHRAVLDAQTWPEFIEEVFAFEMRALPHRRYAITSIARDLGRERLFPALFNYTEFPEYSEVAGEGGHITGVRWFEHVDAPYLVNVGRDLGQSRIEITVNADGRLLPQEATDGIARLYLAVLAQIAAHPSGRVRDTTEDILAAVATVRTRQA